MDERTLFRMALGLDNPWEVKEIKFDAEKQQLLIASKLNFDLPGVMPCATHTK